MGIGRRAALAGFQGAGRQRGRSPRPAQLRAHAIPLWRPKSYGHQYIQTSAYRDEPDRISMPESFGLPDGNRTRPDGRFPNSMPFLIPQKRDEVHEDPL